MLDAVRCPVGFALASLSSRRQSTRFSLQTDPSHFRWRRCVAAAREAQICWTCQGHAAAAVGMFLPTPLCRQPCTCGIACCATPRLSRCPRCWARCGMSGALPPWLCPSSWKPTSRSCCRRQAVRGWEDGLQHGPALQVCTVALLRSRLSLCRRWRRAATLSAAASRPCSTCTPAPLTSNPSAHPPWHRQAYGAIEAYGVHLVVANELHSRKNRVWLVAQQVRPLGRQVGSAAR